MILILDTETDPYHAALHVLRAAYGLPGTHRPGPGSGNPGTPYAGKTVLEEPSEENNTAAP